MSKSNKSKLELLILKWLEKYQPLINTMGTLVRTFFSILMDQHQGGK